MPVAPCIVRSNFVAVKSVPWRPGLVVAAMQFFIGRKQGFNTGSREPCPLGAQRLVAATVVVIVVAVVVEA